MSDGEENRSSVSGHAGDGVIGFAVLGCLVAGVLALFKAFAAATGWDTFLCTIAAVAAFGTVVWLYFSKRV